MATLSTSNTTIPVKDVQYFLYMYANDNYPRDFELGGRNHRKYATDIDRNGKEVHKRINSNIVGFFRVVKLGSNSLHTCFRLSERNCARLVQEKGQLRVALYRMNYSAGKTKNGNDKRIYDLSTETLMGSWSINYKPSEELKNETSTEYVNIMSTEESKTSQLLVRQYPCFADKKEQTMAVCYEFQYKVEGVNMNKPETNTQLVLHRNRVHIEALKIENHALKMRLFSQEKKLQTQGQNKEALLKLEGLYKFWLAMGNIFQLKRIDDAQKGKCDHHKHNHS